LVADAGAFNCGNVEKTLKICSRRLEKKFALNIPFESRMLRQFAAGSITA